MSVKKVKTPIKIFTSDIENLEKIILRTTTKIERIVGSSLGPGGRNTIIESELTGIPNKNTKDGVTIFKSLGSSDAYEHLIIEQTRDAAIQTVNEAGDGTTTATIISAALIRNTFAFCKKNKKYSPQKVTREINRILEKDIVPEIRKASITINNKNKKLLAKVATISANGDGEMAESVIEAFDKVGYGTSSHVTIQELSGSSEYKVELVEGFPVEKGYEESIGKFHSAFINDQGHQRCVLNTPLFVLFDGNISDMVQVQDTLQRIGEEYVNGNSDFANVVIVAHRFTDQVLTNLAYNFSNPSTINVVPLATPLSPIINGQLNFLLDLSAFTGARVFDMNNPLADATEEDFGQNMEKIEIYRFRTTIVGDSDPLNIEVRAADLETLKEQSESKIEKALLEERLGKLTKGIAKLQIFGSSSGELKEKADRAEDAVCAVRAAITDGCLPGGGRMLINLALMLQEKYMEDLIVNDILVPSLFQPFFRLLENSGHMADEIEEILTRLVEDRDIVYDCSAEEFGDPKKLGLLDATKAVEQAIRNAVSISSVMGTLGGIVAFPRDNQLENQEYQSQMDFNRSIDNAGSVTNEADKRY
jgi:chaperonin GroEL